VCVCVRVRDRRVQLDNARHLPMNAAGVVVQKHGVRSTLPQKTGIAPDLP